MRFILFLALLSPLSFAQVGDFSTSSDVGAVDPPGVAQFDKATGQYRISAAGDNIWGKVDAFQFVHRKASGDVAISATEIAFAGEGKNAHRKAGLMIRTALDPDAPYVDVMVHGDGLVALQYRSEKGGLTKSIDAKVKAPVGVRVERKGDQFVLIVTAKGEAPKEAAQIQVDLGKEVLVGLAVSSHDAKTTETALFNGVKVEVKQ